MGDELSESKKVYNDWEAAWEEDDDAADDETTAARKEDDAAADETTAALEEDDHAAHETTLQLLMDRMMMDDENVVTNACWQMFNISRDSKEMAKCSTQEMGRICGRLTAILMHQTSKALLPAIKTIRNLLDIPTNQIVEKHVIYCLSLTLKHNGDKSILKAVCNTISKITSGSRDIIQATIDAGLVSKLVLLANDGDLKEEAIWAISNAAIRGSSKHIRVLVEASCIETLCSNLKESRDAKLLMNILEALQNILCVGDMEKEKNMDGGSNDYAIRIAECGGKNTMGFLGFDDNKTVAKKAVLIVARFWDSDYPEGFSKMTEMSCMQAKLEVSSDEEINQIP